MEVITANLYIYKVSSKKRPRRLLFPLYGRHTATDLEQFAKLETRLLITWVLMEDITATFLTFIRDSAKSLLYTQVFYILSLPIFVF
jgi:hypothetical protein